MSREPEAPILLVDYDPAWPAAFESERGRLAKVLGEWLRGTIEHIGSTAVPGLRAKPVLDIMAGVESLEAFLPAIQAVSRLDYVHWNERLQFSRCASQRSRPRGRICRAQDTPGGPVPE